MQGIQRATRRSFPNLTVKKIPQAVLSQVRMGTRRLQPPCRQSARSSRRAMTARIYAALKEPPANGGPQRTAEQGRPRGSTLFRADTEGRGLSHDERPHPPPDPGPPLSCARRRTQSSIILARYHRAFAYQRAVPYRSCRHRRHAWTPVSPPIPGRTDFERDFPSLCFALATGVGQDAPDGGVYQPIST